MMRKCMLFLISMMMLIFIGCSKQEKTNEAAVSGNYTPKPTVLQSKSDASSDHTNEKKLLKGKIKKLDTAISNQFDFLKDWVSNIGEAVNMME
jgi:hypothetical protein